MSYLTDKRRAWHQNKIHGAIAESACRAHFEALGFSVENFGIEHIAPQYCFLRDQSAVMGDHGKRFKETLQAMPDFLMTRLHPDTLSIARLDCVGKLDVFLVDAKYRRRVELEAFTEEIDSTYQAIHERDIDFYIYLVTDEYSYNKLGKPKTRTIGGVETTPFVHIGCFPGNKSTNLEKRWYAVDDVRLRRQAIFFGQDEGDTFTSVYENVIHEPLAKMLELEGKDG